MAVGQAVVSLGETAAAKAAPKKATAVKKATARKKS